MSRPAEGEDAPSRIGTEPTGSGRDRAEGRSAGAFGRGPLDRAQALEHRFRDRGPAKSSASAGLVGSGRSTLAKAIFGLIPDVSGAIAVAGRPVPLGSVPHAVEAKIGLVPEDRRREGLVGNRSLAENIALTDLAGLSLGHGFGPMATGRIASLFARYRSDLSLMCRGPQQVAQELSGGNQQKVVFAKWLATSPGSSSSTSRHRGSTSMRSATCAT